MVGKAVGTDQYFFSLQRAQKLNALLLYMLPIIKLNTRPICYSALTFLFIFIKKLRISVADPDPFGTDPDQDSAFNFGTDPDPDFQFDSDPTV
jgi:hypothetical protein